jgi:hypothetical protein
VSIDSAIELTVADRRTLGSTQSAPVNNYLLRKRLNMKVHDRLKLPQSGQPIGQIG